MTRLRCMQKGSFGGSAAPKAQPPLPHSQAREVCLQAGVIGHQRRNCSTERIDWLSRKLEIKGWSPYGQHDTCGLTAKEVKEEVRRIRDLLEVDVQNQFDWSACEEEQGNVGRKTVTRKLHLVRKAMGIERRTCEARSLE